MDKLENLLPTLKFPNSRGFRDCRLKMTKDNIVPKILHFGTIFDINSHQYQLARGSKLYPEIESLLVEIASEYFPTLEWTNVQINKNVNCKMHYDKKNRGDAAIIALGNFTSGGHLLLENKSIDIYHKPFIFNGNKTLHGTQDWNGGDRYCIAFYNIPSKKHQN